MDVTFEDTEVMYVLADRGAAGATATFDRIEAILPPLRGRKFYGAIGKTFDAMADRERARADNSRPSIEFYRSEKDLILLLPVQR